MSRKDEFPFRGPQFSVGQRVRVRPEYRQSLDGLLDPQAIHTVTEVEEVVEDRLVFEGQPDEAHYRFQRIQLEGVKSFYPGDGFCNDRFELVD